jgi:hypothetical protein
MWDIFESKSSLILRFRVDTKIIPHLKAGRRRNAIPQILWMHLTQRQKSVAKFLFHLSAAEVEKVIPGEGLEFAKPTPGEVALNRRRVVIGFDDLKAAPVLKLARLG